VEGVSQCVSAGSQCAGLPVRRLARAPLRHVTEKTSSDGIPQPSISRNQSNFSDPKDLIAANSLLRMFSKSRNLLTFPTWNLTLCQQKNREAYLEKVKMMRKKYIGRGS